MNIKVCSGTNLYLLINLLRIQIYSKTSVIKLHTPSLYNAPG
ncbi:unnamed protein product [Acanthoscelides obtectus]|uniref:Uncharacterized protein n=1 Tax=Acanthoscelides obtectus TaxID=200917 RepID=A0A9P0JHS8_ACAOB|nr:unnamed protein product [Acanthoscelides obtectus]CAK1661545.1 hypothetical protein AOBTE_LOCUS22679 [Acanthoscelides obtectus]